jgi:hypothetical protein
MLMVGLLAFFSGPDCIMNYKVNEAHSKCVCSRVISFPNKVKVKKCDGI